MKLTLLVVLAVSAMVMVSGKPLIGSSSPCTQAILLCCPAKFPTNNNFESSHRCLELNKCEGLFMSMPKVCKADFRKKVLNGWKKKQV